MKPDTSLIDPMKNLYQMRIQSVFIAFFVFSLTFLGMILHSQFMLVSKSGDIADLEGSLAHSEQEFVNVVELSQRFYGISPLIPRKQSKCWFHSQIAHKQDQAIFKRLGGFVGTCSGAPVKDAPNTSYVYSEAVVCDCIAPPAEAFGRHFLEIGAADGQYLSNLLFFEMQMGWTGLCVEGSPLSFRRLRKNRPSCRTVNSLIANGGGHKPFYTFESPNSWEIGMSCMQGTACGKDDHEALQYAKSLGKKLKKDLVTVTTLAQLFRDHGFVSFGWIMIDVEGAEDMVIPTINFDEIRADYVSYEGSHPVSLSYITSHGYKKCFDLGGIDVFFAPLAATHC
jgi:FkbM family methyltransferase